jgi:hypothetical protein
MGVLGWTYDQTLDTPMPAIKAALGARNKFVTSILKAVFGTSEEPAPEVAPTGRPLTPAFFDALFAGMK